MEQKMAESSDYIKMDYTIESAAARNEKVKEILENTPSERLTPQYLTKLADYIVFALDKEEKKEKKIITENRLITINKRETSFEGLVNHFENNENTGDAIYNMIANDKNIIFKPKEMRGLTQEDVETIPGLKELRQEINKVEDEMRASRGKKAYTLGKQLIQMRQDQYVLKSCYHPTSGKSAATSIAKTVTNLDLTERIKVKDGKVYSTGMINLYNPTDVSLLLCNYSKLKENCWDNFNSDAHWILIDLENIIEEYIKDKYPLYYDLIIYKIDNMQNIKIKEQIYEKYNIDYTVEYLSSLWRNKIPKLIAEAAENDYLYWYYTFVEKGYWKKCSRCGQIKLGHARFFSKNKTSKDGLYSICKECRNKK